MFKQKVLKCFFSCLKTTKHWPFFFFFSLNISSSKGSLPRIFKLWPWCQYLPHPRNHRFTLNTKGNSLKTSPHQSQVNTKAPSSRYRIGISIRIAYPDKKWNKLNNVEVFLSSVSVSGYISSVKAYGRHLAKSGDKKILT